MKPVFAVFAVLLIVGLTLYIALTNRSAPPGKDNGPQGMLRTEPDFRNKVAELRRDKQRLINSIDRLTRLKKETLQFLNEKGITDSSKITDASEVKYALNNLVEYKADIAKLEKQATEYDRAINGIMAMLDRLERERISSDVALTDDQIVELRGLVINLEDRLDVRDDDILKDLERAQAFDEEMKALNNSQNEAPLP